MDTQWVVLAFFSSIMGDFGEMQFAFAGGGEIPEPPFISAHFHFRDRVYPLVFVI
jgi:hypothetical protein